MSIRTLNNTLKTSLMDYDPFIVAHLIKFERPLSVEQYGGRIQKVATDYTYITDAQYDISYNDGALDISGNSVGTQIYRANKVLSVGTVNENIQAKASNMSLVLDSGGLGATAQTTATLQNSQILGDVDLSEAGFQEGDKVLLNGVQNDGKYVIIDRFKNDGKTIVVIPDEGTTLTTHTGDAVYTISLAAEEINKILANKTTDASYTNYINREVLIYKVHLHPETRQIIGDPYLYFKGITSGVSIDERLESSKITWTLSSHWGDFVRVQGRLTDDATHRALDVDGTPDLDSVIRPEYATDLGFMHANTAVNHLATYMTTEKEYKQVDINGSWFGGKRLREIEVDVPRQTDLQFNLQAKMLPVIYGVRKVDSFPVFVDTHKDRSDEIYKVDAICEGKIAGILDIYVEGNSTICADQPDFDTRSTGGTNYDADTVEVICAGRADRGDTLAHYDANTSTVNNFAEISDWYGGYENYMYVIPEFWDTWYTTNFTTSNSPVSTTSDDATGLLHEGTHSMTSPISADFTFHQGLTSQDADQTLVGLASARNFKIQNDYYTGKNRYWSPSHRLLDTAYVVGKYTIAEGETTLPEMQYVVRGRDPECYNYDGSYKHDDTYTSDAAHTAFVLGSTVTLHKTSDDSQIGSSLQIIDKWSTFDSDGNRDHRFRFDSIPSLGTTTAFYMKSGTNKWHMQTWDHSEVQNTPPSGVVQAHTTFTQSQGTVKGRKLTFSYMHSWFEAAISSPHAIIGYNTNTGSIPRGLESSFSDFDYNSSTDVLDNFTNFTYYAPDFRYIWVKNAIRLDGSDMGPSDGYYVGNKITFTTLIGRGKVNIQERTIIAYNRVNNIAWVDEPWEAKYLPNSTNGTYKIGSIGDARVTLNPSLQLLDYMTNKRYGKGLDIGDDINLSAWQEAGRQCDTRSDVTLVMIDSTLSGWTVGDKYRYPSTGNIQWQGTVSKAEVLGGRVQVTFTDVIGKLGKMWNSYEPFPPGQLYWWEENAYLGTSSTLLVSEPTGSGALSSVAILKVGTSISKGIYLAEAAANGNPIVKKYSTVTEAFTSSGYSLYDGDEVKYWRYVGWDDSSQRNVTRHQMNQVVDTKLPVFDNINRMLTQFNGMLKYVSGKYSLEIKGAKGTLDDAEKITSDDIIGNIKISDKGLKNSKNYISTAIMDPHNKFEGRTVSFFNSEYLKEDKGVQKKGQLSQGGVTNYFNARFNIAQHLNESRYGLTIQFTMAPRALLLTAGSIIELTYERFGYTSKEFRITNLNFKKDGTVDVTADEHDDSAYVVPESAGRGYGQAEQPESGIGASSSTAPSPPTGLNATTLRSGEIELNWTNSSKFNAANHIVQIYRGTVNNISSATVIGTSLTSSFTDTIGTGSGLQTRYYWIRYLVRMPRFNLAGSEMTLHPSTIEPNTTSGVQGTGLANNAPRNVTLDPGTTTNFVYETDGTGIQTGYDGTTTLSTTVVNNAGTLTYKWYIDGAEQTNATSSTFTYTPENNFSDMPQVVKCEVTDTLPDNTTFIFTDTVTMTASKFQQSIERALYAKVTSGGSAPTVNTTAGTYADPANGAATGWGLALPSLTDDGDIIYVIHRIFTSDGLAPQASSWSTPAIHSQRTDGYTVVLTNEAVSIPTDPDGTVSLSNAYDGTTASIIVYRGGTELDSVSGTPSTDEFSVTASASDITAGTIDVSGNTAQIGTASAMTADVATVTYTINIENTSTQTKVQSFSKARKGATGAGGVNSRTVSLSAPSQAIAYDSAGANPSPNSAFTITATAINTSGTVYYDFLVSGTSQQNTTGNTYSYTPPSAYTDLPDVVRVDIREDSSTGTVVATDTYTIYGVKQGDPAYTVIMSNETHTIPCDKDGNVLTNGYSGSGTTIRVFNGTTELDSTNASTVSTGTFKVTPVGTNISVNSTVDVSGDPAVIGDHNNITAETSFVTYTIEAEGLATFTKTQTIVKTRQGETGAASTVPGPTGPDGLRTIQGYLYYEDTTGTAPGTPIGNTYTFSTGVVTGTGIGTSGTNTWLNSPNTLDPASTSTHYILRYYGTEAAASSSTITVAYSTVVEHTDFSGVVTFSNGTFTKDNDPLFISSLLPRSDESEWALGEVTSNVGIWTRNGSGGDENTIVFEEGPHGDTSKVWKSISTDGSDADGGFQNIGTANRFDIADDTVYRFTCFVKQSQADGTVYFGGYNYNSSGTNINLEDYDGTGGSVNKYFWNGDLPTFNEWYLFVGFFNPEGISLNSQKGGLYKVDTGVKAVAVNDFRFNSNATKFAVRTYLYYSSTGSGTIARWAHPRVDRLDKAYPSIEQLLKPIGTGAVNNAVTSIDGGVITTGVINLGTANNMGIRQGKSGYSDDATEGFFIGNDSGNTRLNIGNSTSFLKWDGTTIDIEGDIHGGDLSTSAVPTGTDKGFFLGKDGTAVFGNATKYLQIDSSGNVIISELDATKLVGDVSETFPINFVSKIQQCTAGGNADTDLGLSIPAPVSGIEKRATLELSVHLSAENTSSSGVAYTTISSADIIVQKSSKGQTNGVQVGGIVSQVYTNYPKTGVNTARVSGNALDKLATIGAVSQYQSGMTGSTQYKSPILGYFTALAGSQWGTNTYTYIQYDTTVTNPAFFGVGSYVYFNPDAWESTGTWINGAMYERVKLQIQPGDTKSFVYTISEDFGLVTTQTDIRLEITKIESTYASTPMTIHRQSGNAYLIA